MIQCHNGGRFVEAVIGRIDLAPVETNLDELEDVLVSVVHGQRQRLVDDVFPIRYSLGNLERLELRLVLGQVGGQEVAEVDAQSFHRIGQNMDELLQSPR